MQEPDDNGATVADSPPTFEDDPGALIGVDVGGYVIERELGRGGMGVVYAATHPMIGKRAAIKVIKHSLSKQPAIVERFLREARSVNQIGHPNIVDIFAFGTLPDGRSYLVMDLLDGEPLRKRVKRGAVPVQEALQLVDEIASALIAAHDKGFIHRDLKPDNVYLVANPTRFEVKLLDFGLAKMLPSASMARAFRTATGAQLGTPDYMSPEQLRGSGVDHRTDIYALGFMAFEIITRTRPHRFPDGSFDLEGLTFKQALLDVPGVPEELADLLDAMVARDPDQRPSLAAVRTVLKRVKSAVSAPATSGVRAVGSELSISSFSPSNLGARPVVPTPPTAVYVVPSVGSLAETSHSNPRVSDPYSNPAPSYQPSSPSSPSQAPGLRGAGNQVAATRLGVAPAPVKPSRPHPVAAARRGGEGRLWLFVGLAVVIAASVVLVVVLGT